MAAGLGFKTFQVGEVLLSSDVNGYLMQGVLVFANAAARDAAITSPQEGQCCYLKDTDAVLTYSGAAWVGFDDSNAIQNSIVDAKGDIVAASGNDTPARLAVGNNGETLVADSSTSTGLRYKEDYAAGKNKIINGDFGVWQRGTSFTLSTGSQSFTADRFRALVNFSAGTSTVTQQTFTPGTAPVAGYEGRFFHRITCGSTATYAEMSQMIEDVRTFAGQTITVSFWAKASTGFTTGTLLAQNFGSGGSSEVTTAGSSITLTTSWARYTTTINVPSISGKTIGTSSYLRVYPLTATATLNSITIDYWGVQVEDGSVATAFQTATGTLQGELAACQRYYYQTEKSSKYLFSGFSYNTVIFFAIAPLPVSMRIAPTVVTSGTAGDYRVLQGGSFVTSSATPTFETATTEQVAIKYTAASGYTTGYGGAANGVNSNAFIGFSSEL